jgi:hypothetical protein
MSYWLYVERFSSLSRSLFDATPYTCDGYIKCASEESEPSLTPPSSPVSDFYIATPSDEEDSEEDEASSTTSETSEDVIQGESSETSVLDSDDEDGGSSWIETPTQ